MTTRDVYEKRVTLETRSDVPKRRDVGDETSHPAVLSSDVVRLIHPILCCEILKQTKRGKYLIRHEALLREACLRNSLSRGSRSLACSTSLGKMECTNVVKVNWGQ